MEKKRERKALLEIKNLGKSFTLHNLQKCVKAIEDISITLNEGEFIGITGKSGSGKSTILKCIYRTYIPEGGDIWYNSRQLGKINISTASEREIIHLRKWEIGYISQFLNMMPRTTARQLVEESVVEMGHSKAFAATEAEEMLAHFELEEGLWDSYPNTFSGGEKLRLNIARAMVKRPRLLLLDEPTASLDEKSKEKVKILIEQLKREGTTMLGIFHDIDFMVGVCNKQYNLEIEDYVMGR